ncbi:MAG: hypothetical protein AB1371_10595 [Pseudomonadota bacterium]
MRIPFRPTQRLAPEARAALGRRVRVRPCGSQVAHEQGVSL